jgi:ferredoxin-NADP reductase
MISSKMEAPGMGTFFTACGPPPMMKAMERNFTALGVDPESYFLY